MREFVDQHGVTIVYDVHEASDRPQEEEPRGVVQLLHGVGEHAGRYARLIDTLTAAGYAVYADDHRGHGRTGMRQHGVAAKLGRLGPGGLKAALAGVRRVTEIAGEERPGVPLVLLGHSWGSFLAQALFDAAPEAYAGLVLSGSALRMPGTLNAGNLNAPWAAEGATGLEWLASDPRVAEEFAADPLTTATPLLRLFGPVEAAKLFGRPRKRLRETAGREVPILLMVGGEDTVGGPRSVHMLAKAYRGRSGFSDITTLVYPGARHEIFNDVCQEQARGDLLAWLDARLG